MAYEGLQDINRQQKTLFLSMDIIITYIIYIRNEISFTGCLKNRPVYFQENFLLSFDFGLQGTSL